MPFYHLPHPYNPGYVIPDYVLAEPPGRGTFTTAWMPRGTISEVVPDYLAKPGKKLLGRDNAGLGGLGSLGDTTLDGSTLGGHTLSEPTLSGDTLGARKYTLESLGAADAKRSKFYYPLGEMSTTTKALLFVGVGGAVAYFLFGKGARKNPARRRRARGRRRSRR